MSSQAKVDGSTAQLDTDMEDQSPPTLPKRQKASSFSNTNISKILVFVLCIFIGGGVGIAGYSAFASRDIQQQNAVAIIGEGPDPDNQGKAGKAPPPVCGSIVQCGGEAYTGEVKLTEDLSCPTTTSGDCAITLDGEDAVLDCNKYMIHGKRVDDSSLGIGICIRNGASANNCHVQKFRIGIYVENGGEVNDCEVMFNDEQGISIANEAPSTTKMKISNTYIHDNGSTGISFIGGRESPESSETSIEVNNVKSNHNGGTGMRFSGQNVKLEVKVTDSETSNNDNYGIFIIGVPKISIAAVDVELDGINSRYNGDHGLFVSKFNTAGGEVKVKGDVNLYKNGLSGFFVNSANVDVVVERRGALNSCGNLASGSFDADIRSSGLATFSGNGYTCDSTSTSPNPPDIITCDPCPNCPQ
eukprot:scaffold4428_cov77-Skeletonema_dohrnii-CCMP3373.AAC.3